VARKAFGIYFEGKEANTWERAQSRDTEMIGLLKEVPFAKTMQFTKVGTTERLRGWISRVNLEMGCHQERGIDLIVLSLLIQLFKF
jgi:hypothetical protein